MIAARRVQTPFAGAVSQTPLIVASGTSATLFTSYGSDYGYYWWLFPEQPGGADNNVITASGSGGQWLFVIPKFDLVVAIAASNGDGLGVLYNAIFPALNTR